MSEVVIGGIFGLGGALLGGFLGYAGSMKSAKKAIEANRKKDNYEIERSDLDTRIRSMSGLRRACDSYLRIGFISRDPKVMSAMFRELVIGISDVLAETPWVFEPEIFRKAEDQLKSSLCMVEATFNDEVRPLLGPDLPAILDDTHKAALALKKDVEDLRSLAESRLYQLIDERNILMKQGIPR